MNFKLYFVDNEDQKFYKEARMEYAKRLSRYCKLEIVTAKDEKQLRKKVDRSMPLVVVFEGKELISSEGLAEEIKSAELQGISRAAIVIGSAFEDLSMEGNNVVKKAISPMRLSECLLSVVLLEQIYRAYRIIKNEPYHK